MLQQLQDMTTEELQEHLARFLLPPLHGTTDTCGAMLVLFSIDGRMHFRGQVSIETAIRCFRNMADRLEGTVTPAIDDGSVVATAPPVARPDMPEPDTVDTDLRPGGPHDV